MTFGGMITAIGALGIVVGIATIVLMVVKMHRHDDWFDDDPEPKQGDLYLCEEERPPPICPECGKRQFYAAKYDKCYSCGRGIE